MTPAGADGAALSSDIVEAFNRYDMCSAGYTVY